MLLTALLAASPALPQDEGAPRPGLRRVATPPPPVAAAPGAEGVVIFDVTVIPMDRERVLTNQTVVVRNGVITELGSSDRVGLTDDLPIVNGRGRYLLPGLADMHAHLLSDYETPDELAGDELFLMLTQGVTTARLVIGTPEQLELRARVRGGELLAPDLHVASPQLCARSFGGAFNGYEVKTPEQGREAVRRAAADGYQFIKLTFFLTLPIYEAIVEEAAVLGLPVIGHIGPGVGLERALAAGQQIEHLDQYLEALLPPEFGVTEGVSGVGVWMPQRWRTVDELDEGRIAAVARATVDAGVWNTPTLTFLHDSFAGGLDDDDLAARPDARFWPAWKRSEMERLREQYWSRPPSEDRRKRFIELRQRLTLALHESGAKLLCGSDAPEWYLLYGYTVHRELAALVDCGLTPWQALETATRHPAEWLATDSVSGTVEVGKRADLLLLDANPLDDISNTSKIAGVVVRGRWLDARTFPERLDAIAEALTAEDEHAGHDHD